MFLEPLNVNNTFLYTNKFIKVALLEQPEQNNPLLKFFLKKVQLIKKYSYFTL